MPTLSFCKKFKFMTKEEVQAKSNEKAKAIQTLCEQLQVTISAEQMINERGFIKLVVFYNDNEKYDVEEPDKNKKDDKKTTNLRKKDTEAGV